MPITTKVLSWSVWVEQDLGVIRLLKRCGRKHNLDTGANRAVLSSGGEARPQLGLQVEEMCNVQSKSQ